jgi:hypothetical protein
MFDRLPDLERGITVLLCLAAFGFVALVLGSITLIAWLLQHVRFV